MRLLTSQLQIFVNTDAFANSNLALTLDIVKAAGAASLADSTGGCVDANLGISINAGAEGSIPGVFDATKTFKLFEKKANVFKVCRLFPPLI